MIRSKALVLFLSAASAGCGSQSPNASNSQPSNAGRPDNVSVSPTASASPSTRPSAAERVTIHEEVTFPEKRFPDRWQWVDPTTGSGPIAYEISGSTLKFTIPTGRDLYAENRSAPRLLKAVDGDFQLEVRVGIDPKSDYQGAGLIVYSGPENYLRLERGFGGVGGGKSGLRLDVRNGDDYRSITTPKDIPTDARTVDLKVLRSGNTFIAFWRLNEDSEWREVGQYDSNYAPAVEAGIIACNTGSPIPVEFSALKIGPP